MGVMVRHGFKVLWLTAATVAFVIYYFWHVPTSFVGVVESRTHRLGSQEGGRIGRMLVYQGAEVRADQLLAEMDMSDLETEKKWLQGELDRLDRLMDTHRRRYELEYERLRLQRDSDASAIGRRRADLEAKRAELGALNAEIDRLARAEQAGLGRANELSSLVTRRDAIARFVKEEDAALTGGARQEGPPAAPAQGAESDSVVLSMLGGQLERMTELEGKLETIEGRIDRRRIVAPCEGRVVGINYLPGDTVKAFETILTIEEPRAGFVDAYVPEASDRVPSVGQSVAVHPRRVTDANPFGTIVSIDPGYSPMPERLANPRTASWVRRFRVQLEGGEHLVPGEFAFVELLDGNATLPAARAAQGPVPAETSSAVRTYAADELSEAEVPPGLREQSRVEPSGIAWLAEIERYVFVSDDSGRGGSEHAPWVFLMDRQGRIEPKPVRLAGTEQVNDLEAIAVAADGSLYLVSSQSVSKQGKRPKSRQQILKVKRSGRDFEVVSAVDLLPTLIASYGPEQLHALGLGESAEPGQLLLNIEGAAWLGGDLLLGLKQPRAPQGALIWRLSNPDRLIEQHVLDAGQLTLFGYADLRTPDGTPASISDLLVDERGELFALSTIPMKPEPEQVGGMHRLIPTGTDKLRTVPLYVFPKTKPEGMCSLGGGRYTIVFDSDDTLPIRYLNVATPDR